MKQKRKRIIIATIITIVLVILASIFYVQKNNDKPLLDFDKSAKTYKSKIKKPEEWAEDRIAFPAFKEVKVVQGSDKAYMALENPSFNEAYLQFSLFLNGEKTPFYESGLVKPGKAITEIPLPKKLSVGSHVIKMSMKAYAPNDDKTTLNGTNTSFVLQVLKRESDNYD